MLPLMLAWAGCPKAPPSDPLPTCEAPAQGAEWFAQVQQGSFLRFAQQVFGPVRGCTTSYETGEYGLSAEAEFQFASGATFRFENQPPESTIQELRSPSGFPDPAAATAFLRTFAAELGWSSPIDWSAPQTEDAEPGEQARVYWSPDEGANLSFREIYRDEQLVAIRASWAL